MPWTWESFGQYLDGLENKLAVNAGFLVGHCAIRRYVMGEDFAREATPKELDEIAAVFEQVDCRPAASASRPPAPRRTSTATAIRCPSRWASEEEVLRLCEITGRYDGTSLELITQGCLSRFADEEVELMAQMSGVAHRPLNWNVLGVSVDDPDKIDFPVAALGPGP